MVRNRVYSIMKSGVSFVTVEWSHVFAYIVGPFGSESNLQMISEAGKEFFANFDWTYPAYQALYPRMVLRYCSGVLPEGYGTVEHMQLFFKDIQTNKLINRSA